MRMLEFMLKHPQVVVLVGCGGIGARMAGPLSQLIPRTMPVFLVDPDVVELRNLTRQHFGPSDVGKPKALVLKERYFREFPEAHAVTDRVERFNLGLPQPLVISGVDSRQARAEIYRKLRGRVPINDTQRRLALLEPSLWIDAGNDRREGQMILTMTRWRAHVRDLCGDEHDLDSYREYREYWGSMPQPSGSQAQFRHTVDCDTMFDVLPAMIDAGVTTDTPSCAVRVDLQTVGANMMAATLAVAMVGNIMDGVPLTTLGSMFTCQGTVTPVTPQRIGNSGPLRFYRGA